MSTQKELNNKYGKNLHVVSNNTTIVKRDPARNMDPALYSTVYIEPVSWIYDNASINTFVNTRFTYFKFPPKTIVGDVVVPDDTVIDTILTDVVLNEPLITPTSSTVIPEIDFDGRYIPSEQMIHTIPLLLPTSNKINYGWNELISEEEFNEIRSTDFYNATVWDSLLYGQLEFAKDPDAWNKAQRKWVGGKTYKLPNSPDKLDFSKSTALAQQYPTYESKLALPQFIQSKYFEAHKRAKKELQAGISTGRYRLGVGDYFNTGSLFEGFFRKIKFNELINGQAVLRNSTFVVTKDLINSKKSFEFNVQVAISHLDNHARNNFVIRLIKYTDNPKVSQPYVVEKTISSATQGYGFVYAAGSESETTLNNIKTLQKEIDAINLTISQKEAQVETLTEQKKTFQNNYTVLQTNGKIFTAPDGFKAKFIPYSTTKWKADTFWDKAQKQTNAELDGWKSAFTEAVSLLKTINGEIDNLNKELTTLNVKYNALPKKISVENNTTPIVDVTTLTLEQIMDPRITHLWPGKTFFKLNYVLTPNMMRLNDRYSIEMLALEPQEIPHELIEENSYWDIKEIKKTSTYTKQTFNLKELWGSIPRLVNSDKTGDVVVIGTEDDVVEGVVTVLVKDINGIDVVFDEGSFDIQSDDITDSTTDTDIVYKTLTKKVLEDYEYTGSFIKSKINSNMLNTKLTPGTKSN